MATNLNMCYCSALKLTETFTAHCDVTNVLPLMQSYVINCMLPQFGMVTVHPRHVKQVEYVSKFLNFGSK